MLKQVSLLVKSSKNSLKVAQLNIYATKFQFSSRIPYNFDGIHPGLDQSKTEKLDYTLQKIVGKDAIQGFSYAYDNLIQAIAQKDFDFLQEILEPNLFNVFKSSLLEYDAEGQEIEQNQQIIYCTPENDIKPCSVAFGSFDIHTGVYFERHKNGVMQEQRQSMNMSNFTSIHFYGAGQGMMFNKPATRPIIRIDAYFNSNLKLHTKDRQGIVLDGEEDIDRKQIHKIRFESDPGEEQLNKSSLFQMMFKLQSGGQSPDQLFGELLLGQNFEWKISDIDDSLNGNEFDAPSYNY